MSKFAKDKNSQQYKKSSKFEMVKINLWTKMTFFSLQHPNFEKTGLGLAYPAS
jgi:hypothetical protein